LKIGSTFSVRHEPVDKQKLRVSEQIHADLLEIARQVVDQQYKLQPELWELYGERGYHKCIEDTQAHLAYLAEAVASNDTALFVDYVRWAGEMLNAFHVPPDDFAANLRAMRIVFQEHYSSEEIILLSTFLDLGLAQLSAGLYQRQPFLKREAPLGELAIEYLDALLQADRKAASRLIINSVSGGTNVKAIYLDVFQPVQYELGRLWQTNVISVAQEHYCTAETQRTMAKLSMYFANTRRNGHRIVAACIDGELHDMGIRMVTDFFEMAGWETFYIGANSPLRGLLAMLTERKTDVLALSVTITSHLDKGREIIRAVRAHDGLKSIKIMVGGYPFNVAPKLWQEMGADGCANDGDSAVRIAEKLVGLRRK
jgi:methanogenic corrinoid protein MtbC1